MTTSKQGAEKSGDSGAPGQTFSQRAKEWLEGLRENDTAREDRARIFVVVGLGPFGVTVATELMRFGTDVIGIDSDEVLVNRYANDLTQTLILDAKDEDALREAGVGDCHVGLVAMASDLEATVMAVVNLRYVGVKTIWAEADSRKHHRILSKLGVDRVIQPAEETGRSVAQMLHNPLVRDYATLGNGYHVVNFIVPDTMEERKLSEIELFREHDVRVLGVMRGSEYLGDGRCEDTIQADDKLILLGTRAALRGLAEHV